MVEVQREGARVVGVQGEGAEREGGEKAGIGSWMLLSTQQQPGELGVWNVALAPVPG